MYSDKLNKQTSLILSYLNINKKGDLALLCCALEKADSSSRYGQNTVKNLAGVKT